MAGNIEVLLCGRQNMPASAELVAAIAGTRGAWITTQQTHAPAAGLLTGLGSRSRGREYVIHPDTIKSLDVGEFVVIEPRLGRAVDRPRLPSRRAATPWCRMLTERDMTITEWIGRQGAVRAEHVMTRFSIGRTATYRRLHELVEFGLVRRHRLLYNDGGLLTATAEGLRCAGLDRLTPARISLALVPAHDRVGGARRRARTAASTTQTLLSDREHRAAENAAGEPIASAIIGSQRDGREGLHRPDFALIATDGQHVTAVEVELTLKNRTRLERILRGYLRNQNVSVVRYHTAPPIADAVRRAARAVGAEAILELAPLPSARTSTIRSRS